MRMFHMANDSGLFRTRDQLERDGWTLTGNVSCEVARECSLSMRRR